MKIVVMGDLHYHATDETVPGWLDARNGFYQTFLARFLEIEADAIFHSGI